MSLQRRIKRLEERSGAGERLLMVLWQTDRDPELFIGPGGRMYRQGSDDWPDPEKAHVIRVVYNRP